MKMETSEEKVTRRWFQEVKRPIKKASTVRWKSTGRQQEWHPNSPVWTVFFASSYTANLIMEYVICRNSVPVSPSNRPLTPDISTPHVHPFNGLAWDLARVDLTMDRGCG